jgi:hypothetical protein
MKRLILPSVTALMLAACATKPVRPDAAIQVPQDRLIGYQSPVAGGGEITIVRDRGMLGGGCYAGISINGKLAAKVDTGERANFYLAAGRNVVSSVLTGGGLCGMNSQQRAKRSTEVFVSAGETSHL